MGRWTAILLLAGCFAFQVRAQTPQGPGGKEQAPAAKPGSPDRNPASEHAPEGRTASPAAPAASPQTAPAPWDRFQEFSALMVGDFLPGDERPTHIYRSANLFRAEAIDRHSYWVVDLQKGSQHLVAARVCGKSPFPNSRAFPFFLTGPQYKYESVLGGEETVNGHVCRIEDVTINSARFHQPVHLRLWEAEDLQGFPIKIENRPEHLPHRSWTYEKVDVGPQDPTLFIYPENCRAWSGKEPAKPAPKANKEPAGKSQ